MTARTGSGLAVAVLVATAIGIDLGRQAHGSAGRKPVPPVVPLKHVHAAPAVHTFADPASGISLNYPADWKPEPSKTAELAVADPAANASLSLDVPPMTMHPFFIPIGLVASRYVEDLRHTQVPDAVLQETTDLNVSGASARRVTARGHAAGGGGVCVDTAVVIVHKGQVYILSCDSDPAGQPIARAALDAAVASVHWSK